MGGQPGRRPSLFHRWGEPEHQLRGKDFRLRPGWASQQLWEVGKSLHLSTECVVPVSQLDDRE